MAPRGRDRFHAAFLNLKIKAIVPRKPTELHSQSSIRATQVLTSTSLKQIATDSWMEPIEALWTVSWPMARKLSFRLIIASLIDLAKSENWK